MRRGDIVTIAQRGVYEGKPRPAVVIQADAFLEEHPSVLVCHVTAGGEDEAAAFFRIAVAPSALNGLNAPSIVLVDRISTIRRANIGDIIGHLEEATLARVDAALALFRGLS